MKHVNASAEIRRCGNEKMSNRGFRKPEILGHSTKAEIFDKWQALLEAYTTYDLRKESDKFPAISRLAKMQQVICYFTGEGYVYLAGLWKSSLAQDLLWQREVQLFQTEPPRGRPQKWRAPSWNWDSINGPINGNYSMGLASQIELIHYEYVSVSNDTTGQIRPAWIILRGRMVSVTIERTPVRDLERQRDGLEGFRYRVKRVTWLYP
jgi:hypothetical protein